MRLQTETNPVERGGVSVESGFSIKATSKAFDILSSGLYSDKILAIVRELSCNAYDSHVAAGKKDVPIEIHLPTYLDPTFYVKDNGLGLSDFDVRGCWEHENGDRLTLEQGVERGLIEGSGAWDRKGGIYNTYFESTKTSSDDFIGQLGLGSKSPFSYASTFMVESRFNGIKSLYSCYKNEAGLPAVTLMGQEATTESNGVTVTMSVRKDDIDKFANAAKKALMYFNPKPAVAGRSGFTPYTLKHTVEGSMWRIRAADYFASMNGPFVVQGFVAYPVDAHQLREHGLDGEAAALADTDVDLYVPIGKVEVAASREALSYNKATITNLIDSLKHAATEMRASFQIEFDKCKTRWEALMLHDKYSAAGTDAFKKIYRKMHQAQPFKWNGVDIDDEVKLDLKKIVGLSVARVSVEQSRRGSKVSLKTNGSWDPSKVTTEMAFAVQSNLHILIDDTDGKRSVENRVAIYLQSKGEVDGRKPSAILIRPLVKGKIDIKMANKVVAMFDGATATMVSSTPAPARTVGNRTYTYVKRDAQVKMVWNQFPKARDYRGREAGYREVFSRLCWINEQVDMNAGGLYVEVDRFSVQYKGSDATNIQRMLDKAIALGLVQKDIKIVGLNEKELKAVKGNKKWSNFFDHVREAFNKANANGEMVARAVSDGVFASIGSSVRQYFVQPWTKEVSLLVVDGPFKQMIEKLVAVENAAGAYKTEDVNAMMAMLGVTADVATHVAKYSREWRDMLRNYDMLTMVSWDYSIDKNAVNKIAAYVNLIDRP